MDIISFYRFYRGESKYMYAMGVFDQVKVSKMIKMTILFKKYQNGKPSILQRSVRLNLISFKKHKEN